MIIRSLCNEKQSLLKGAAVNIYFSVNNIVISLPRSFNEAHVIKTHLRRRLEFIRDYVTDTIRPEKSMETLRFLVNTRLYGEHNIHFNENWILAFNSQEEVPFIASAKNARLVQYIYIFYCMGFYYMWFCYLYIFPLISPNIFPPISPNIFPLISPKIFSLIIYLVKTFH